MAVKRTLRDGLSRTLDGPAPAALQAPETNRDLLVLRWSEHVLAGRRQALRDLLALLPEAEAAAVARRVSDRLRDDGPARAPEGDWWALRMILRWLPDEARVMARRVADHLGREP